MASHKTISYVSLLLLFISLTLSSCSKDSDLFDETIQNQIEEETTEDGELINSVSFSVNNDEFTISGTVESAILDVLKNDSIPSQDLESFQIVAVSDALEGDISLNEDNTITYSPKPESANKAGNNGMVTDEFTYTVEVRGKGSQNKYEKKATVVVNTQYGNVDMGALKAFPGAKGFGQNTIGGRGGRVIHVTNLNEDGPGSLVEAIHASGPRIIVFDVAGEINWTSEHAITDPYCTIAGQTAPSPGITIRGGALRISASEVIVRFLRIRPGNSVENDAVRILNRKSNTVLENVIIDHVSMGWANDEIFAIGGNSSGAVNAPVRNVTLQNSIIHENLDGYNYAALLGRNVHNMSVIQNYWANNGNRVPEHTYADGSSFEFVNNVLYNYNRAVTVSYGESIFDSVGNVFKPDSDYPPGQANHHYQLNRYENPNGLVSEGIVWEDDNIEVGSYSNPYGMTNNNWKSNGAGGRGLPNSPYTPIPSSEVIDVVLNDVGPSVLFPDPVDARLIGNWTDENGIQGITDISVVGGFPNLVSVAHPATYDTDNDGMADAWEIISYGDLSSKSSEDNNGNGYSNIEEFIYSINPK